MKCSVVIPVRNGAHTLVAALAGVLGQEGVDLEVVVVDDGSVDQPELVVNRVGDPRVHLIRQSNSGVSSARNHGAACSTGDAVVFLDADDEVEDGWLAELTRPLADEGTGLVSCAVVFRREGVDRRQSPRRLGAAFGHVDALFLAGAFCVRRDLWERCGGYASALSFGENTELGIRLSAELRRCGLRAVASPRPLLVSHRAPLWIYDPVAVANGAAHVLRHHREAVSADPAFRLDYLTAHGVNSARRSRWDDAKASLRTAWRLAPTKPSAGARALLARMPALARWIWTVPPPRALMAPVDSLRSPEVEISIVVPTFQGAGVLHELLTSLVAGAPARPWEVVVADNGSTDGIDEVVAPFRGVLPVRLVDASANRGVSAARNAGAMEATGRKLLFVDQDDLLAPGAIAALADALDHADVVGPRIDCESLNPGWVRHTRSLPQEHGLGQDRLPWVYGSGLGVRREAFFAVRGFDGHFDEGCEDVDLCWRLGNLGYRIAYVPGAVLHYRFRSTIPALYRQARSYGRAGARLHAMYRAAGLSPPSAGTVLRQWSGVARRVVTARTKADRARAAVLVGNRVGRVQGALRHRVIYG